MPTLYPKIAAALKKQQPQSKSVSPLPDKGIIEIIIHDLLHLMFPGFQLKEGLSKKQTAYTAAETMQELQSELSIQIYRSFQTNGNSITAIRANRLVDRFLNKLPAIHLILKEDLQAAYDGDPAAKSLTEILLCYPGFTATAIYRLAHELYLLKVPLIPRIFTEYGHQKYGIDIHPGATIGKRFCIDHGTGVVIGETAQIGNDVRIYQHVTLGASNLNDVNKERGKKRHPTIEDRVIIYSGASVLGGQTVIKKGAVIGGNVWLINETIPERTMVVQDRETVKLKKIPLNI